MKNCNFLKMFLLASFVMPALFANAQSKLDNQVLMTIGNENITVKEFTDVYYKNNLKSDVIEKKTVDEYLDLFTTFRMKDSYIIGTALDEKGEERIVGMESLGDPWSCQKQWIEECINSGCEVVVAASRSYGQTVDDACGLAGSSGYEVIEVSTYIHVGSPKLLNGVDLRDAFAENMISLIRKCLK